jgi:type IV secretory pathway VirB2 component (pilin)
MDKLKSRKFWMAVLGAVCALFLAITGQLEWALAIKIITGVLATYIGIEGLADALGRLSK